MPTGPIDALDARLIELLAREPRVGVLEASRRLGFFVPHTSRLRDRFQTTTPW